MTNLRQAAQQALEALVWEAGSEPAMYAAQTAKAITNLRAALAEPERKPLSDDEIAQAMYRADAIVTGPMQFRFAKEIERAHGIKEQEP